MMPKKQIFVSLLIALVLLLPALVKAQAPPAYDRGMYVSKSDTMPYRILFPDNFDPEKKYPLIVMLHGSGEKGNDNDAQLKNASWPFIKNSFREKYPAIVVFPQCPANSSWTDVVASHDSTGNKFNFPTDAPPTKAMHALMGLIKQLLDKPFINLHQVYIGGLSMGGMGTFEIIGREPRIFAAAFPMCGGDNTLNAGKYAKKVPVWIFHGEKDNVVSPDHSIAMYEAIKAAGGDPKLTIIPDVGHQCWDAALSTPDFMDWLFLHTR
jgi:predicted peptidase